MKDRHYKGVTYRVYKRLDALGDREEYFIKEKRKFLIFNIWLVVLDDVGNFLRSSRSVEDLINHFKSRIDLRILNEERELKIKNHGITLVPDLSKDEKIVKDIVE